MCVCECVCVSDDRWVSAGATSSSSCQFFSPHLSSDSRLFWLPQINEDKTNQLINKMVDLSLAAFYLSIY